MKTKCLIDEHRGFLQSARKTRLILMICRLQTHAGTPRQKAFCKLATSENMAVNQMFLSKRTHISHEVENRPSQCNAGNMKPLLISGAAKDSQNCHHSATLRTGARWRSSHAAVRSDSEWQAGTCTQLTSVTAATAAPASHAKQKKSAQFHMDGSKMQIV